MKDILKVKSIKASKFIWSKISQWIILFHLHYSAYSIFSFYQIGNKDGIYLTKKLDTACI